MRIHRHKTITATITAAITALTLTITPTAMADMRGIDVSGWQPADITSTVDYDFAVVKVTQGTGYVNPSWRSQASRVLTRDKSLGLYHYAGGNDAIAEADYYLSQIGGYVGDAVLVLDWESNQNTAWGNGQWVASFVNRIHDRTNVWPIIYVQASAISQIPASVWANCGLWVAQYANNQPTGYQSRPWNYGVYGEAMRQYTSTGRLAGYAGNLDLDYFRGEEWQWDKYADPDKAVNPNTTPAPSTPTVSGRTIQHVVRSGETIWALASYYDAWPLTAWRVPSGNINVIYPGQTVTYNGTTTTTASGTRTYVVQPGDYLTLIAGRLGIVWTSLTGYRSGNPSLIYPGEVLYY